MTRSLSELSRMMADPMGQINAIFDGANLLRREEHSTPPTEYEVALHMLQGAPDTENMDTRDGYVLVIPVTSAADLIADNYVREVPGE